MDCHVKTLMDGLFIGKQEEWETIKSIPKSMNVYNTDMHTFREEYLSKEPEREKQALK